MNLPPAFVVLVFLLSLFFSTLYGYMRAMLDWFGRKYNIHVTFFEMIIVMQTCGTVRVLRFGNAMLRFVMWESYIAFLMKESCRGTESSSHLIIGHFWVVGRLPPIRCASLPHGFKRRWERFRSLCTLIHKLNLVINFLLVSCPQIGNNEARTQ